MMRQKKREPLRRSALATQLPSIRLVLSYFFLEKLSSFLFWNTRILKCITAFLFTEFWRERERERESWLTKLSWSLLTEHLEHKKSVQKCSAPFLLSLSKVQEASAGERKPFKKKKKKKKMETVNWQQQHVCVMHLIWFDLLLVCFTKWLMRARPNSLVTGAAASNCRALMPVCLSLALIRLPMCSLCNGRHRQKKVRQSETAHKLPAPVYGSIADDRKSSSSGQSIHLHLFPFLSSPFLCIPSVITYFLLLMLARVLQFTLLFFSFDAWFFYFIFYPFRATHFVAWMLLLLSMLLTIFYLCIFFPFWLHHFGLFDHCRTESRFQIIRLTKICRDFSFVTHSVDSAQLFFA